MEHYSVTKTPNKIWVSADKVLKAITDSQLDYEFSYGITGKYTKFIQERDEALRKEMEAKADRLAKKLAKENGHNPNEEEMVC